MSFQPGQVVMLQSGGPAMTVIEIEGDEVLCVWMEEVGKRKEKRTERFPTVTLKPHTPTPAGGRSVRSYRG